MDKAAIRRNADIAQVFRTSTNSILRLSSIRRIKVVKKRKKHKLVFARFRKYDYLCTRLNDNEVVTTKQMLYGEVAELVDALL